jgi:two-component sensor histidine kinase
VHELALSYNIDTSKIDIKILVEDLYLDIDRTAVTGLIINELVSNSFKYAFTPDKPGKLSVQIWKENQELIIKVNDSGIGLPDNIDIESTDTLGLQLIRMLVNQIDGSIKYKNDDGAQFVIRLPN